MGFLSRLAGFSKQKEAFVIRELRESFHRDPIAHALGGADKFIDRLSSIQIMGTPEATAITCAESYARFKARGFSEESTCREIASLRRIIYAGSNYCELMDLVYKKEHRPAYVRISEEMYVPPSAGLTRRALAEYLPPDQIP